MNITDFVTYVDDCRPKALANIQLIQRVSLGLSGEDWDKLNFYAIENIADFLFLA